MSKPMARAGAMKWKQSAIKMLVGAAAGLGASAAVMALAGAPLLDAMGPSRLALAAVGFVYLLIAVFVGLGVAVPRAGAGCRWRGRPGPGRRAERPATTRSHDLHAAGVMPGRPRAARWAAACVPCRRWCSRSRC